MGDQGGDLAPQKYVDARPPEEFERFHEFARTHRPRLMYTLVRVLFTPPAYGPMRVRTAGMRNIPSSGPVLMAANHFSQWDHFIIGAWAPRQARFMAKSQLYANPVLNYLLTRMGAFPVHRGAGDETWVATALELLRQGQIVLMYPEGGRSRSGAPGRARPGVGRLALESGAPVVPVALHGTLQMRRWRENLRRLHMPPVTVQFGEPMRFDRVEHPDAETQRRVAEEIFSRVREMYAHIDTEMASRPRRAVLRELRSGGGSS